MLIGRWVQTNRGCGFSLDHAHPNVIAPNKRPYQTIIPSLVTDEQTGDLCSVFGVMGGYMQPQGHVQVLLNQVEFGMDPQRALDQPRVCVGDGESVNNAVLVEEGIAGDDVTALRLMGHQVSSVSGYQRVVMGRGQVITRGAWWASPAGASDMCTEASVYWAGSDPRADGCVAAC